jgi:hypothetical protein
MHSAGWAGFHTGRIRTVVTQARQVVIVAVGIFTPALVFVPIGSPGRLLTNYSKWNLLVRLTVEYLVIIEVPAATKV